MKMNLTDHLDSIIRNLQLFMGQSMFFQLFWDQVSTSNVHLLFHSIARNLPKNENTVHMSVRVI